KLPISLSSKPDYSDYVDQSGQSHPRTTNGTPSAAPRQDRYQPFMPNVNLRRNVQDVFLEARNAASRAPGGGGLTLVGTDRALMVLPVPPRSAAMDARVPKIQSIPSDRPRTIAVVANTGILSVAQGTPPDLQEAGQAIPFLGLLIALGYVGHRIWIFEGH